MAGKAAAPGTAVLLVTANVGSLFDDVSAAPSAREGRLRGKSLQARDPDILISSWRPQIPAPTALSIAEDPDQIVFWTCDSDAPLPTARDPDPDPVAMDLSQETSSYTSLILTLLFWSLKPNSKTQLLNPCLNPDYREPNLSPNP